MEGIAVASFFVSEDLLPGLVTDDAAAIVFPAATVVTAEGVAGAGVEAAATVDPFVADAGPVANSIVEATGEPDMESGVAAGALFEASANADADAGTVAGAGGVTGFAGF